MSPTKIPANVKPRLGKKQAKVSHYLRYEVRLGNGQAVYQGADLAKAEQMFRAYASGKHGAITVGAVITKLAKVVLIDHGAKDSTDG